MTKKPESTGEQDYRTAMSQEIATQWAAVWKAIPEAIKGKDIEAVHRVRVSSRRLRAAMDVSTDCFPAKWYRPLHKTAKEITQALGEVRDRDVLLEALANERADANETAKAGIDFLVPNIKRDRKRARKQMIRFLTQLDEQRVRKQTKRRFPVSKTDNEKAVTLTEVPS